MAFTTALVQLQVGTTVNYCRPLVNGEANTYEYYVDDTSTAMYSFGTIDFPFKRFDAPFYELLNLVYNSSSVANIYVKRNTSTKLYFVSRYIYILNMQNVSVSTYGDPSLPNPKLYVTNWPYTLPDSDLVTLA